ncbi:cystathionine gamma-synthase [Pseudomonadota bacterium]|jgi:cystathionine gamma-synthase|nr:cystathionine gamma-synthase [Xanthomonadales bacterium]
MSKLPDTLHQDTLAARFAIDSDQAHGAVIPPLYLSSNFSFHGFGEKREYDYTRSGNPNRDQLADALAGLEGGAGGVITASGMSAVHLATQLVKPGELIVAPHDCYGGCHRLFSAASKRGLFELEWLPLWETAAAAERIRELAPRLVWIETPSNPLLRITDIEAIAQAAHDAGALVVVDNTFLSPAGQRPFKLGADIVLHSTTKYINGHSDVVGGAVLAKDEALVEELTWWANCLGLTGSPFDSYQTLRGLRTLNVRYRQHEENATAIADYLDSQKGVRKVYYPGLRSHPGHGLAKRQQESFGAMISFEIDASAEEIPVFLRSLKLFTLAESLGGVESLVAHPASMTHAAMSVEDQAAAGIRSTLLRLSVGIEHVDDLLADLTGGFEAIQRYRESGKVRSVA